MKKIFSLIIGFALCSLSSMAMFVKGLVKDKTEEPLIGATVRVIGENIGTITDIDGNFDLNDVPQDAVLEISYAGYITQKVEVAGASNVVVVLEEDIKNLDEVVVIGYGTSKSKDLTSPIETVKGAELISVPTSGAMSALQGKISGINITNSGTPGQGPSVTIRGAGTFGNAAPLYVVDGMFYDNIDFLNNADIEDLSVLKDASATAIYGVKAANGVVIITTKKGKYNQRPDVTYDGYVGVQTVNHKLKMASSNQYAQMMAEANDYYLLNDNIVTQSAANYGGVVDNENGIYTLDQNTDWYDELIRHALITNHSLNINGGGDKATYGVGINYLYQDGVMNSNNGYNRFNLRGNVDYKPFKWLTVGFNSIFSNANQQSPNNAAWQQAFNMPGAFPVFDITTANEDNKGYASPATIVTDANFYNPVATAKLYDSKTKSTQIMANVFAQFNIWKDKITLRTSYGYDFTATRASTYVPKYFISSTQRNDKSTFTSALAHYHKYVWDNTITYDDQWGRHAFKLMLGHSMRDNSSYDINGTAASVQEQNNLRYLNLGEADGRNVGDEGAHERVLSFFGRLNYSYANKYLFMFTLRRDGSSKYNDHWGTFPSIGLAWVLSEEPWLKQVKGIDFLKLRASWGLVGNNNIASSSGKRESTPVSSVYGNSVITGYANESYFSWLGWETVNETNVGLEFGFLDGRLTGDLDWYYRMTQNAVVSLPVPLTEQFKAGNWAHILNMGVDLNINWEHKINKNWTYFIGGNLGWLHNEVKKLRTGAANILQGGKTVQMVGEKMNSFYGFKVVGVYQTQEECDADPIAVANGLTPGDFKYEDVNNDGKMDNDDKQILGSYIPDVTYGFNLGFKYKGLDFTMIFTGKAGFELYNKKRAFRVVSNNYNFDEAQYKNRWHGAGTTNSHPSAAALNKSWNISDSYNPSYFVEKADYFRLQNITLGYTFFNVGTGTYKMQSIRLSLSADKPYTWFKAHSMTPELSDSEGWDTEVYPLTATYTFSVQLKF